MIDDDYSDIEAALDRARLQLATAKRNPYADIEAVLARARRQEAAEARRNRIVLSAHRRAPAKALDPGIARIVDSLARQTATEDHTAGLPMFA
jgi:hypothetical protein